MKDYYGILGITNNASISEIKDAYRKLSKKFHPDKNEGDKFFEEMFKAIQEAYRILSDEQKRRNYDDQLNDFNKSTSYQEDVEEILRKEAEKLKNEKEKFKKQQDEFNDKHFKSQHQNKNDNYRVYEAVKKDVSIAVSKLAIFSKKILLYFGIPVLIFMVILWYFDYQNSEKNREMNEKKYQEESLQNEKYKNQQEREHEQFINEIKMGKYGVYEKYFNLETPVISKVEEGIMISRLSNLSLPGDDVYFLIKKCRKNPYLLLKFKRDIDKSGLDIDEREAMEEMEDYVNKMKSSEISND